MSSLNQPRIAQGFKAGADLSAKIHRALKFSAGKLIVAGAGEGIGFCYNAPKTDEGGELVMVGGGGKGVAAGTITQGAELKSDANGLLTPATSANDLVIAIAMEAAVLNDVFEIMPILFHKHA